MERVRQAVELFDRLCEEIMYGFNMKCELVNLIREESDIIEGLQEFLEICEAQRSK